MTRASEQPWKSDNIKDSGIGLSVWGVDPSRSTINPLSDFTSTLNSIQCQPPTTKPPKEMCSHQILKIHLTPLEPSVRCLIFRLDVVCEELLFTEHVLMDISCLGWRWDILYIDHTMQSTKRLRNMSCFTSLLKELLRVCSVICTCYSHECYRVRIA